MEKQTKFEPVILYILLGVFILSIIGCIIYIAASELTTKESALLSIVLTIISIVATWIVSNIFANFSHKKAIEEVKEQHLNNLKTYALNAAEKVDNLSNELSRLSVYLQEELEKDIESPNESDLSKTERIESAIHIVNTLKSVNDTSLSDWKGVIGEELDEIREEKIEREIELRDLVERVEEVVNHQNYQIRHLREREEYEQVNQITALRKDLSLVLNSVMGSVVKPKRILSIKQQVELPCPHCKHKLIYKQRPKSNSYKTVNCTKCNNRLLARWQEDSGFVIYKEEIKDETINCPWCQEQILVQLSNIPLTKIIHSCPKCEKKIKLIRNINGISISNYTDPHIQDSLDSEIDLDLIEKVKNLLPKQPWTSGIHKEVAQKLGVPNQRVGWAIQQLIIRGEFQPQIDGVLYYKKENLNLVE